MDHHQVSVGPGGTQGEIMQFEPLEDRVLVLRVNEAQKGLIVVPDAYKEKAQVGIIKAISLGHTTDGKFIEPSVEVDDKILFGKYSGTEIKLDDIEYIIMREGDILGILHEGDKDVKAD